MIGRGFPHPCPLRKDISWAGFTLEFQIVKNRFYPNRGHQSGRGEPREHE